MSHAQNRVDHLARYRVLPREITGMSGTGTFSCSAAGAGEGSVAGAGNSSAIFKHIHMLHEGMKVANRYTRTRSFPSPGDKPFYPENKIPIPYQAGWCSHDRIGYYRI